MFVKGGQLLQRAQEILTSDDTSVSSDPGEEQPLGLVYHYRGLLEMFNFFASGDLAILDKAIENADMAMVVWRKAKDLKNAAETLNLVGSLAQKKGMKVGDYKLLEKAEESLKESLEIREAVLSR